MQEVVKVESCSEGSAMIEKIQARIQVCIYSSRQVMYNKGPLYYNGFEL